MSMAIVDQGPAADLPKPKDILIDGDKVGTVEPERFSGGELRWHAAIHLEDDGLVSSVFLVQGHGATVEEAIHNAVVQARQTRDRFAEQLAGLEVRLGVNLKTNEELWTPIGGRRADGDVGHGQAPSHRSGGCGSE